MADEQTTFLLDVTNPRNFSRDPLILRPDFYADATGWEQCFRSLDTVYATQAALEVIDRVQWKSEIPNAISLRLDEKTKRERVKRAVLDQELDSLLYLLIGAGIPVAVIKAMDVGRRYYSERIFRPINTVDVVVPPEGFAEALRYLGRGDYRIVTNPSESQSFIELRRREKGPSVRLHRRLFRDDDDTSMCAVFHRASEKAISGLPFNALGLSVEDNFLYLVCHGVIENRFISPVWLNDLHYLIASDDFKKNADWDRLVWALANHNALAGAWSILHLVKERGASIPEEALPRVGKKVGFLHRKIAHRLSASAKWLPLDGTTRGWAIRTAMLLGDSPVLAGIFGRSQTLGF